MGFTLEIAEEQAHARLCSEVRLPGEVWRQHLNECAALEAEVERLRALLRGAETLWCIYKDGKPNPFLLSTTRSYCIADFMKIWDPARTNWRKLKRRGFSCRKCTVSIREGWVK